MTLHQTWLAPDGSGKAAIDPPRKEWPGRSKTEGVVSLLHDDAELTTALAVCEGIENGLTAARVLRAVWAALDAHNLAVLPPVRGIECLLILADHDRVNPRSGERPGMAAALACADAWSAAGVEVRIWQPERVGQDLNDWLMAAA
jgi:hypothetical protein